MQAGLKLAGRYALQALLGSGGMGEVWRGVDEQLDRPVAVKVLQKHLADRELAGRFRREARIAARLQHPGITVVHDVGSDDGQLFIVMELLHGRDLAAVLAEAPAGLPIDAAVSLTIQAAEALRAAHAGHVVHRDLKPANLFVLNGGQLKMCDFGIARAVDVTTHLTSTGHAIGTPAYMSPEQCLGQQVDGRSDLYSLGCVLYALLTGQPPFAHGQPLAIMSQHLNAAPAAPRTIRPDVPPELDHLVLELLAKDPAQRPADAGHVITALQPLCYTPTVKVEPTAKASTRLDLGSSGRPGNSDSQNNKLQVPRVEIGRHLGIAITLIDVDCSFSVYLNNSNYRSGSPYETYEEVSAGEGREVCHRKYASTERFEDEHRSDMRLPSWKSFDR